jgi:anti-sigma factor RsiW
MLCGGPKPIKPLLLMPFLQCDARRAKFARLRRIRANLESNTVAFIDRPVDDVALVKEHPKTIVVASPRFVGYSTG